MRRMLLSMSQEKLGEALGLTFQQVQKYEKGMNRIGAGRLQQIGQILSVPPSYFFEDMPDAQAPNAEAAFAEDSSSALLQFLSSTEGLLLTKAFVRIKDAKVRRKVIDLVTAFANSAEAEPAEAIPSLDDGKDDGE